MATILTLTFNPALDLTTSLERMEPHIKLRCQGLSHDPGGGGINVARVMSRMGASARAVFPAGGSPGRLLTDLLEAEGVDALVIPSQATTRENLTVQERATGFQYRFLLPGGSLPEEDWRLCLDSLARLEPAPDLLVVSGSLPEGAPSDLLARVALLCRERGISLAVDSSGEPLKQALEVGVDLVKVNRRELHDLTGVRVEDDAALQEAAQALRARGAAGDLLLTLAEGGAQLYSSAGNFHCAALPVALVSAVGAGDSFLAAFLLARLRGEKAADCLRWGVAAGSAALLTPGTELALAEDIERLFPKTEARPLE